MIYYLPLEPYEERYTLQLKDWTESRFAQYDIPFITVEGKTLTDDKSIVTGVALDAHGRSYYSLTQTAELVKLLRSGEVTNSDVIYSQDMFHPGWESIPYILDQLPDENVPRIYTHCLAQSIDSNDFTFPMRRWMRHYELMVDETVTAIFVASSCQVDMLRSAMFNARIVQTGLLFDKNEVKSRVKVLKPLTERKKRIVFSSRWDDEKQPWFYMDIAEKAKRDTLLSQYEFSILTGSKFLRSNNFEYVERAKKLSNEGIVKIYEGLRKSEYYEIVADSQLHFNCALQDFVSNTLNEASALGTPSLLPAYLSFPETVNNNERHLYVPWSQNHAMEQMVATLTNPPYESISYPADTQHQSLDRVIEEFMYDR